MARSDVKDVNERLKDAVERLGGTLPEEPMPTQDFIGGVSFFSVEREEAWEGKDPLGELVDVSETIRSIARARWNGRQFFYDDFDLETWVSLGLFGGASENYDVTCEGKRLLLYLIGYEDIYQYFYAVDLLDQSDDPVVYKLDHGEPEEAWPEFTRLSLFLATLKTQERVPLCKRRDEWVPLIAAARADGNFEKAIELSRQALDQHPTESVFLVNLGNDHSKLGDRGQAEACYRQALEIAPDDKHALTNLGNLLARRDRLDEAKELFERALASDSSYALAHHSLACVCARLGQKARMLEATARAIALDESRRAQILDDADFTAFKNDPDFLALITRK